MEKKESVAEGTGDPVEEDTIPAAAEEQVEESVEIKTEEIEEDTAASPPAVEETESGPEEDILLPDSQATEEEEYVVLKEETPPEIPPKAREVVYEPEPEPAPPRPAPAPAPAPITMADEVKEVPKKRRRFTKLKIILLIAAIIAAGVVLTFDATVTNPREGVAYPYTTTYDVRFPDGEQVTVANTEMMALTFEDEMIIDVNGVRDKIVVGEEKLISERRAIIKVFAIPLVATNFRIYMKYLGMQGEKARFYLTVTRSNDVPQFLINQLLPAEIEARPA
jgi:hypothetical protein